MKTLSKRLKTIEKWFMNIIEKAGILFIIFFMMIIYYLSTIPGIEDKNNPSSYFYLWVESDIQKLGHIAVYALWAIFWCAFLSKKKFKMIINMILVIIITVFFGLFTEWSQIYVPGRYASISDGFLNLAGVITGLLYWKARLIAL